MRGVYFNRQTGKWRASIQGRYLGEFSLENDAVSARRAAELDVYGAHSNEPHLINLGCFFLAAVLRHGGQVRSYTKISPIDADFVKALNLSLSKTGYVVFRQGGRVQKLHRALASAPEGALVDHIDGDPMNNRRDNLRLCSALGNARNKGLTTGRAFKGTVRTPYGWVARITVNRKPIHLGTFASEAEAARAYDKAAAKYFGQFARTNHQIGCRRVEVTAGEYGSE